MSTLSSLRLKVYDHTGRNDKVSQTLDGLNFGIKEIVKNFPTRDKRLESDLTLSAGVLSVALPTSYFHIVEARFLDTTNENSYPLEILSKREFVKRIPLASALQSGKSVIAYEEGGRLFVAPVTTSTHTIRITTDQRHVDLTASGTIPITGFDLPLVLWASHYIYSSIQMFQQSAVYLALYKASVKDAMDAERTSPGWDRIAKPFHRNHRTLDATPWLNPFADYHHAGGHHGHGGHH